MVLCEKLSHLKRPWCWERSKAGGEGEDRGWDGWIHHWLKGCEFEQTPRVGDGQGSLECCNPWGHKELDTTERLNWTEEWYFQKVTITWRTVSYSFHSIFILANPLFWREKLFIPYKDKEWYQAFNCSFVSFIGDSIFSLTILLLFISF